MSTYSLTLRQTLGRRLSIQEMDGNFLYLSTNGGGDLYDQIISATTVDIQTLNGGEYFPVTKDGEVQALSLSGFVDLLVNVLPGGDTSTNHLEFTTSNFGWDETILLKSKNYNESKIGIKFGAYYDWSNSGTFSIGDEYMIENYQSGDDFSNVASNIHGSPMNSSGCVFTATGEVPTNWSNGSGVRHRTSSYFVTPIVEYLPNDTLDNQDSVLTIDSNGYINKLDIENVILHKEVTKSELDYLINNSLLVPNTLYKITGTSKYNGFTNYPALYDDGTDSGTTIYLKAISTNQLEKQGTGEFYNPKYTDYNIWSPYMYGGFSNIVGYFTINEVVTADNGATGILIADGIIRYLTGNWNLALSIIGNLSSATANISSFGNPTYSIGTKVIWGGYVWVNVNGNLGEELNPTTDIRGQISLNSEWIKQTYGDTDYNKVFNLIEYDYENDLITRRYSDEDNIDVICTKNQLDFFSNIFSIYVLPISYQQWGRGYNAFTYTGVSNIKVIDSFFECINFTGKRLSEISLQNSSFITLNYYATDSKIYNLEVSNFSSILSNNIGENCSFSQISLKNNSSIQLNSFGYTSILGNIIADGTNAGLNTNFMENNCTLSGLNFIGEQSSILYSYVKRTGGIVHCSFDVNCSIYQLSVGSGLFFEKCKIKQGNLQFQTYPLVGNVKYTTFNCIGNTNIPDLSLASEIYGDYPKEVYVRPDSAIKIKYINNSDNLTVVNIDA